MHCGHCGNEEATIRRCPTCRHILWARIYAVGNILRQPLSNGGESRWSFKQGNPSYWWQRGWRIWWKLRSIRCRELISLTISSFAPWGAGSWWSRSWILWWIRRLRRLYRTSSQCHTSNVDWCRRRGSSYSAHKCWRRSCLKFDFLACLWYSRLSYWSQKALIHNQQRTWPAHFRAVLFRKKNGMNDPEYKLVCQSL